MGDCEGKYDTTNDVCYSVKPMTICVPTAEHPPVASGPLHTGGKDSFAETATGSDDTQEIETFHLVSLSGCRTDTKDGNQVA